MQRSIARRRLLAQALLALAAVCSKSVLAQPSEPPSSYPARPVTLVLPGAAGGGPDQVMRLIADFLSSRWKVPVIAENKPGATGMIGAESVARADSKGYRLLFAFTAFVQAPAIFARVPYDLDADFVPITQVANAPVFLAVRSDSPIRSLPDLGAETRARGKPLSYGSFGIGSSYHIYGESLSRALGLRLLHVPYKGEALALTDLLGGQIELTFVSVGAGASFVRAGKIRPLGLVGKTRSGALPDIPTFAEQGVPGLDAVGWFGFLAPAGTPPEVVRKLSEDINAALRDPTIAARLKESGFDAVTDSDPQAFKAFLRSEAAKWRQMISQIGIKPE